MATMMTSVEDQAADRAASRLRTALAKVLAEGNGPLTRLGHARTSVRFAIRPGDTGVTLLLDRRPVALADDGESAEIEIAVSAEQALVLAQGRLPLPAALMTGAVRGTGPVRRYLEVDPILQGLLRAPGEAGRLEYEPTARPGTTPAGAADWHALETRDLHKRFGTHQVLAGLDLAIPEGVVSVVLGPSGTGKSVLLQHIIGLLRPDRGEVIVRGTPLSAMSRSQLLGLRREIGVMFQDGALFSRLNVYDNVAFPLREHTDLPEAEIREVVMARLGEVGLKQAADRLPAALSGGMKKRAGLARALVLEPGIVLCDEPDSGLDPVRTALLGELLAEQHAEKGGTMVVVTHNVSLAKQIADHMSVLWRGKVLEAGFAGEVLESDSEFVRQFLAGDAVGPLGMDA
jgi:phospholipid/cholesterol/gamma-HCH transport system ATP-binding protein